MRILLVEDEAEMAGAMRTVLEREGYVVDHVAGLADLREAARLANSDVVLLDRALPDGDGVEAIPELRQCIPGIPVIVITARAEVEDRVSGLDLGADDYLAKPFAMEELLARIRAIRRRPAALDPRVLRRRRAYPGDAGGVCGLRGPSVRR